MPLYTAGELVGAAACSNVRFAIPAFNIHNMEYTKAVIAAAEKEKSPVILLLGEPVLKFAGLDILANIALFAAKNSAVPAAVLLDHGKLQKNINRCLKLGICLMVDGSDLPYDSNVAFTKSVVEAAHQNRLTVEGELGTLAGSEDDEVLRGQKLTDPDKVADFVSQTQVDMLAISIGNAHGLYKGVPYIDFDRLIAIKGRTTVPIVMHGGSDLPESDIERLIESGVSKFNIGTDLKIAYSVALREILTGDPIKFQPFESLQYAMDITEHVAREKIKLLRASGKAALFGN